MKILSAGDVARLLPYGDLVEALRQGFAEGAETPVRHHHETGLATTLMLMPSWSARFTGIKTVTIKTDNAALNLPTVQASYLLIDNATGTPVAVMDGTELTRRRTAAASALASDYLSHKQASKLLLIGAGALAPHFAHAHSSVRAIKQIQIFNRNPEKAIAVAAELAMQGLTAEAVTDVEMATREADIISCMTTSTTAIVKGAWLKPGAHVDLAGAFRPTMRETDSEVIAQARVYVDTREGALAEAGDLLQAQTEGQFTFDQVQGDLAQLCQGKVYGRQTDAEITLFKSCGTGLEDLAAAELAYLRQG
ncbi:MAG: ornithine cyclodeaminase family protein [Aestuariivirga sp.]